MYYYKCKSCPYIVPKPPLPMKCPQCGESMVLNEVLQLKDLAVKK